jgi:hypothetical protein
VRKSCGRDLQITNVPWNCGAKMTELAQAIFDDNPTMVIECENEIFNDDTGKLLK